MSVSMKYISRATRIQIGSGEHYAVQEIQVSVKQRPVQVNGIEEGIQNMGIEDGVEFYEMDWRTTVKLVARDEGSTEGSGTTQNGKLQVGLALLREELY